MTTPPLMADWSDPGTSVISGPGLQAFAFYAGGNTPHDWDRNQVDRQTLRYAAPIWTYGHAGGRSGGLKEGAQAREQLRDFYEVPPGVGIACWIDLEGWVDQSYVEGFRDGIGPDYWHGCYGQASTVFANVHYGAGWWVADWTGHPFEYPHPNVTATQYEDAAAAGTPWDWSELASTGHLWDRHAAAELDGHVTWWEGGSLHNRGVASTDAGKTWR
jgi:hypothetical protein